MTYYDGGCLNYIIQILTQTTLTILSSKYKKCDGSVLQVHV